MLQVGQTLWFVPRVRHLGQPQEVTVAKVGRKWAELDGRRGRIAVETLAMDGGEYASPGRCYLSREAWESEVALREVWRAFQRQVERRGSPPEGVTEDTIRQAVTLLRLDVP